MPADSAAPPPSGSATTWSGADALVAMGVDVVAIDTAHGHSAGVIKAIERIKGGWPDLPVVAGNVVTEDGVDALPRPGPTRSRSASVPARSARLA